MQHKVNYLCRVNVWHGFNSVFITIPLFLSLTTCLCMKKARNNDAISKRQCLIFHILIISDREAVTSLDAKLKEERKQAGEMVCRFPYT